MPRPADHQDDEHAPQALIDIYTSTHDRLADDYGAPVIPAELVDEEVDRAKDAGVL